MGERVSIRFFNDREVREENQLVSATTQLKLTAADGKRNKSDVLDREDMVNLAKTTPHTTKNWMIKE